MRNWEFGVSLWGTSGEIPGLRNVAIMSVRFWGDRSKMGSLAAGQVAVVPGSWEPDVRAISGGERQVGWPRSNREYQRTGPGICCHRKACDGKVTSSEAVGGGIDRVCFVEASNLKGLPESER